MMISRQSAADPDQIQYTWPCQRVTKVREFGGAIGPFWAKWRLGRLPLAEPEFLPCDAMHSAAIAGMRCPSVTFVSCAKTTKDIFEIFSPSGSQAILVFP